MNVETRAAKRSSLRRKTRTIVLVGATLACGSERDFGGAVAAGGTNAVAMQPPSAEPSRSPDQPVAQVNAGGSSQPGAMPERPSEVSATSEAPVLPAGQDSPSGVQTVPANPSPEDAVAPGVTSCDAGPGCGEACSPGADGTACVSNGREGRCVAPGLCMELCQLNVSNLECLLQ